MSTDETPELPPLIATRDDRTQKLLIWTGEQLEKLRYRAELQSYPDEDLTEVDRELLESPRPEPTLTLDLVQSAIVVQEALRGWTGPMGVMGARGRDFDEPNP